MKKKIFSVNLIIFIIISFFLNFNVFANEKIDNSIKLDEIKLTPIIITPTTMIFEDNENYENIENNQVSTSYTKVINGLIYYTQYGNYYKLPNQDGGNIICTIHYAGCGPTTSAMIIASYIDKSITPEKIVDYFAKNGYYAGCSGTSIYDNKTVIEAFGVKTSADVMSFSLEESDKIIPLIKNYLKAGWTFFALANFTKNGGEHYFWIVDIDDNGNIWSYDPWYGKNTQPFNENTYYPFPKYRQIFKVRK